MKEGALEQNPLFNKNVSGLPQIQVVDGGAIVNDTLLPVIGEPIISQVTYNVLGEQTFTFNHDLKSANDCLVRIREDGTEYWYTLPAIYFALTGGPAETVIVDTITNKDITILFNAVNFAYNKTWDIEIYFLKFKFE